MATSVQATTATTPTVGARAQRASTGPDLEVAVLGAGPHGLSAAVHLRRAGVRVHVFGTPMGFWKKMPLGMRLRSNMSATNMIETVGPLSLASFTAATGTPIAEPVPLEDFVAYGSWVQRTAVPDVDERMVDCLTPAAAGFELQLGDERVTARRVVIACGIAAFEQMPKGFGHLSPEHVSHTAHHRDLSVFVGRRVLIVGGGQSAFECAALLHEQGAARVEVLVRRPGVVWLRGHAVKQRIGRLGPILYAPTDVGPMWYTRLVERPDVLFRRLPRAAQSRIAARCIRPACSNSVKVRLDEVHITTGAALEDVKETGEGLTLTLSDGSEREVDHVMFGTGYRVDVARYPFLGERVLAGLRCVNGYPVLARGLESSVPRLHFTGAPAAWSYGPIMRFVSGSWYGGRSLARAVAHRSQARRPSSRAGVG
jgi:FAD-dependent urate hydroxylase